jgi:hydroxymethylglutaryl-CoA reductase (NADPH)
MVEQDCKEKANADVIKNNMFSTQATINNSLKRWELLNVSKSSQDTLFNNEAKTNIHKYNSNIENFIGTVSVPVGLAGPIRINGKYAKGDYYVPLATTEAALVASYSRGAKVISLAGGCETLIVKEGINRNSVFSFSKLNDCEIFIGWIKDNYDILKTIAESTTSHGKLINIEPLVDGHNVYVNFEYTTGNAAGQNMITIATEAAYTYIKKIFPIKIQNSFLESNASGDKKATHQSLNHVRGKKVIVSVNMSEQIINKYLKTTPDKLETYQNVMKNGAIFSGAVGTQGHVANVLAAIYLACGQDVACVSESSIGNISTIIQSDLSVTFSLTLPNIIVGTVGGGIGLPSQQACLDILGLDKYGDNASKAFAEIIAGLCLAGELSLGSAICSDSFSKAHRVLRKRKEKNSYYVAK